jgi:hypothetical protein
MTGACEKAYRLENPDQNFWDQFAQNIENSRIRSFIWHVELAKSSSQRLKGKIFKTKRVPFSARTSKPLTTKDTKVHEGNLDLESIRDSSCPCWLNANLRLTNQNPRPVA